MNGVLLLLHWIQYPLLAPQQAPPQPLQMLFETLNIFAEVVIRSQLHEGS